MPDKKKKTTRCLADTEKCGAAVVEFIEGLSKDCKTPEQQYRNLAHGYALLSRRMTFIRFAATKARLQKLAGVS